MPQLPSNFTKSLSVDLAKEAKIQELEGTVNTPLDAVNYSDAFDHVPGINRATPEMSQEELSGLALFEKNIRDSIKKDEVAFMPDHERGTISGQYKNLLGGALENINEAVGNMAEFPVTVYGNSLKSRVDDKTRAFADLYEKGEATPEQMAYLNSPSMDIKDLAPRARLNAKIPSRLEMWEKVKDVEHVADEIDFSFKNSSASQRYNRGDADVMDADFDANYKALGADKNFSKMTESYQAGDFKETVSNAGAWLAKSFGAMGEAAWDNPIAAYETIVSESAETLLFAPIKSLLLTSNMAYAGDVYREARKNYEETHGRTATKDEETLIGTVAITALLAEQVGDTSIIRSISGGMDSVGSTASAATKAAVLKSVNRTFAESGKDVLKRSANTLAEAGTSVVGSAARTTAKGSKTGLSEGGTELYQTAAEENLSQLNTDFDGQVLAKGMTTGALVGGGTTGTIEGAKEVAGSGIKLAKSAKDSIALANAKADKAVEDAHFINEDIDDEMLREAAVAANESGDISGLTDPTNRETYSPETAVGVVLARAANTELSVEDRAAATESGDKLITSLREARNKNGARMKELYEKRIEAELGKEELAELIKVEREWNKQHQQLTNMAQLQASAKHASKDITVERVLNAVEYLTKERIEDGDLDLHKVDEAMVLFMQSPEVFSNDQLESLTRSEALSAQQRQYARQVLRTRRDSIAPLCCLVFVAGNLRRIVLAVTGFTVAHSLTLALSALKLVELPVAPVEAAIALSIVFMAREILGPRRDTLTWRHPMVVSCCFGLLHGLGFAAVLTEIGLPQTQLLPALVFFNLGVELGQLLFIVSVVVLYRAGCWLGCFARAGSQANLASLQSTVVYAVGGLATLWMIERVDSFI